MYPLLSASPCSITSFHFPLGFSPVFPWATGTEVWHNSLDISQEADWPWCCCCYAWRCSVLRRPQPWEHGPLRNVSKYSFRLTPFLPLSSLGSYTTSPPQLGIRRTVTSRWKKPAYYFSVTGLNHCTGCGKASEESEWVLLHPLLTAATVSWRNCLTAGDRGGAVSELGSLMCECEQAWIKLTSELEKSFFRGLKIFDFWSSPLLNWHVTGWEFCVCFFKGVFGNH